MNDDEDRTTVSVTKRTMRQLHDVKKWGESYDKTIFRLVKKEKKED